MSPSRPSISILCGLLATAIPTTASANAADTATALAYVGSVGAGALAGAVNGSYLAFGEPASRGWRWFGWVAGGIDLVWAGAAFGAAGDRTEGIVLGSVALGVGAAAILTATFVDEDVAAPSIRARPLVMPSGGGLAVSGRF